MISSMDLAPLDLVYRDSYEDIINPSNAQYLIPCHIRNRRIYFDRFAPMTREDVAVTLVRLIRGDAVTYTEDVDVHLKEQIKDWQNITPWKRPYVDEALCFGVVHPFKSGKYKGRFMPKNGITRAGFALALLRTYQLVQYDIDAAEMNFMD